MTMHTLPMPAPATLARISHLAGTAVLRVVEFFRAYKNRRDMQLLSGFDDRMLRDIGLTRGDLHDAVAEPLWRDPTSVLVSRVHERRVAHHPRATPAYQHLADAPSLVPGNDGSSRAYSLGNRAFLRLL